MKRFLIGVLAFLLMLPCYALAADTIKLGFNIPLTGDIPDVGESSKNAAEMLKAKVNGAGGLEVGGKKYQLEFIYEDNESKAESAVTVATKLITQGRCPGHHRPPVLQAGRAGGRNLQQSKDPHDFPVVHQSQHHPGSSLCLPGLLFGSFPGSGGGQVRDRGIRG